MVIAFTLDRTEFMALNRGPQVPFTAAASIIVRCDNQAEIDQLPTALTANGGQELECGWLKDRFGLPWPISSARLREMMAEKDRAKMNRVMVEVMRAQKFDLAKLEAASTG